MPPKPKGKATTKKSAEEPKVEAEKILPDGARTLFVGGWSTLQSIYKGIASLKPCERLVVLPGIYSWEGEEALEVPPGTEIYAVPNLQKASEAADSSDPSGDERTRSDCDAAVETVECAPSAPVHEEVLFTGSWKLTSKKPTNPPASTEIPPASTQIKAQHHNAAEKEKSGAGSVTATSRPDAASPRDPQPESTTRTPRVEKDAALIQASVFPSVTPVDPSTWESVKISRVTFEGFVTVSALHATFTSCVFRALEQPCEASHCKALLTVYHYCKVKVFESLFLGIKHVGLALLPLSEVTAQRCTFTSDLDGELQCPSDSMTLASGKSAQNDMQTEQEVQDDEEEEEEKVSLTKKENSTTRLVSPTRVRRPGQRLNTSPLETQQEVAVLFQHCGPCTIVHSTFHHLYCAMMALGSPHAVFEGNTIHHIRNTALLLDHNAQCKVQKNNVKKCQFYALQSIPVQGADTGNPVASQECHNNTKLKKKKTQVQDDSNEGEHDETSSAVTELVKQPARVFGNQFYGMGRVARGSRVIIRDTLFTEGLRYDGEEEEPYLEPTY